MENQEQKSEQKKEGPKTQSVSFPNQKTFFFPSFTPSAFIDKKVNNWMRKMIENKTPVMLGKITSSVFGLHMVYLFTTQETRNVTPAK